MSLATRGLIVTPPGSAGRAERDSRANAARAPRRRPRRRGCARRARHRANGRRDRRFGDGRRHRARRVRRRRARSSVAAGVRALPARRSDGDDQPARIDATRHRSRRSVEGRLRDARATRRPARRTARRLLRSDGRRDRGVRRLHRNDAALRTRDRLCSARRRRLREVRRASGPASLAPSSTRTISDARRFWAAPAASARGSSRRRCSTIRTATATNRRRSSC